MLPESYFKDSRPKILEKIENERIQCIDPKKASISFFADEIGDGRLYISFRFQFCHESSTKDRDCLSEGDAIDWMKNNTVIMNWFQSATLLDLYDTENSFSQFFDYMRINDAVGYGSHNERWSTLRMQKISLFDDLINPFDQETQIIEYLKLEKSVLYPR